MHKPTPDVSQPKERQLTNGTKVMAGKIFYGGKKYRYILLKDGVALLRDDVQEPLYVGSNVEDCCGWLMAQQAV